MKTNAETANTTYSTMPLKIRCSSRVHCGHCMKPGVRRKLPDAKVFERFVLRSPEEQVFASKEYLSRKLLEHVLSMELLPEIMDKSPEKVKSQPSRREAGKEE